MLIWASRCSDCGRVFAAFGAGPHSQQHQPQSGTLLQMHHLLVTGAEINQRDEKGFTPLHRAAYLAHHDGYMELYEYLLVSCHGTACRLLLGT